MGKNFSLKLAPNNIKNNRKFYLPYFLASVGIIAMFYIISFLSVNKDIRLISASLAIIMEMGVVIMAIFSFIFLFYTNSFLMKRRKKEIGLYNILGMEKRHIGKILIIENVIVSGCSIVLGLFCGVLFSKLIHLFLGWIFDIPPAFGVEVSIDALAQSCILFGILFLLTMIANQMSIRLSKPIELLSGGNVGEKEPKAKGVLAIIGFVCLGIGYYIAITTDNPLTALMLFFVAVALVIVGTYCLFTAGSIVILKAMRKNKKFYYRPSNFTAVSGMIYRMKQNAAGLANICILSTMVLVMVSGTVSLFFGMNDTLSTMAPGDVNTSVFCEEDNLDAKKIEEAARERAKKEGLTLEKVSYYKNLPVVGVERGNGEFVFELSTAENMGQAAAFGIVTQDDYFDLTGKKLNLQSGETAVDSRDKKMPADFRLGDSTFHVKTEIEPFMESAQLNIGNLDIYYIVVSDEDTLLHLYQQQSEVYGDNKSFITYQFTIDVKGTDEQKAAFADKLVNDIYAIEGMQYEAMSSQTRHELESSYGGMVTSFLFLGVFLGIVFTFAAALIIYYKQISEGYYDKEKFEIMQKVGMSRQEVKRTIRRQVLLVFFIPLVMAGIHIMAAFKMITNLLTIFSMNNVELYAICTLGTFLVFAVIYALVYVVTAREYYKIVG
ncbi:MAG: FtsX-like permease family protein [Emergencia sp.]|nr:FtsX-like permease family protein [Emergencia sp.]